MKRFDNGLMSSLHNLQSCLLGAVMRSPIVDPSSPISETIAKPVLVPYFSEDMQRQTMIVCKVIFLGSFEITCPGNRTGSRTAQVW